MYLVLASKSPRRKEILANAGYNFKVIVSSVDENVEETSPIEKVGAIARKKGLDVYSKCTQDAVVISADTIVSINDEILGKPKDIDDARKMISMLQGKTHQVYTAVFIKSSNDEYQFVEKTDVHVANMTSDQIENYIKTTEPYDKAGGYGIQGIFGQYITGINGDYFNVMGLPINRVREALSKFDFTSNSNYLICPICNQISLNEDICENCGFDLKLNETKKQHICNVCGKENEIDALYCERCGSVLNTNISAIKGIKFLKLACIFIVITGVLLLSIVCCLNIFSIAFAITAIVFSILSIIIEKNKRGYIALIISIIEVVISIIQLGQYL